MYLSSFLVARARVRGLGGDPCCVVGESESAASGLVQAVPAERRSRFSAVLIGNGLANPIKAAVPAYTCHSGGP